MTKLRLLSIGQAGYSRASLESICPCPPTSAKGALSSIQVALVSPHPTPAGMHVLITSQSRAFFHTHTQHLFDFFSKSLRLLRTK